MKKRRLVSLFLSFLLLLPLFSLTSADAYESFDLDARAGLLIETDTGEILYEKNAHQENYPASLTKIMTALLVFEAIDEGRLSLNDSVTATESALNGLASDGSTANIVAGETMTVEQLLNCMLIVSANETCNILGEYISGSVEAFVARMNDRATELGCEHTQFANATGLHNSQHYTTAWDLYLITREAMKHDKFMEICNSKSYTVPATNMTDKERELHSTNALISNWRMTGYLYSGAQGIKTGTTDAAGHCLVSSAIRGSRTLISVVLGCEEVKTETGGTRVESFSETARLFDWGFDNFADRTVLDENELICEVPVALSNEVSTVAVRPAYTAEAVLPKDLELEQLQRTVTCVDSVDAPVTTGDELGTITISYDGTDYVTVPLLAVADVSASRFLLARKAIGQFFSRTPVKIAAIVLVVLVIAVLVWFRLYGRTRRYGRASSKRYRQHTYRGRRR